MKKAISVLLCAALALSLCAGAHALEFPDVTENDWFAGAVEYCVAHGLMQGVGDGFDPDGEVTRAQIVTVLYRLANSPEVTEDETTAFNDVPAGEWYEIPVRWAAQTGVAEGVVDGSGDFLPGEPVTREQLAVLFWRFESCPEAAASGDFTDQSEIAAYADEAVRWAKAAGVMKSVDRDAAVFAPQIVLNRAQLAQTLMNYDRHVRRGSGVLSEIDVLCAPNGIARMGDGSLLVTDTYYKVVWRVANGMSTIFAGTDDSVEDLYGEPLGGYHDASPAASLFRLPWAVAPFLNGWAISDAENNAVRYITADGAGTLNGHTKEQLTVTELGVAYDYPTGLATGDDGSLYIADTGNGAIRRVTPEGEVTTYFDGLDSPMGLCWHDGTLYIAETGANQIVKIVNGRRVLVAGSGEEGFTDGPAANAELSAPQGVAVGADGTVYVADTVNGAIRRVKNGVVDTLLAPTEGQELKSYPVAPVGMIVYGNELYVCDRFARTVFAVSIESMR